MHSQTLSLDAVSDGAVLAEPLLVDGVLLLPAGAVLTPAVIAHLRQRDIQKLTVEMPSSQEPAVGAAPTHDPAAVQERLAHLFRYALGLRQLNPLFHIVTAYRLGDGA